jgi:hypothetical protein
MKTKNILFLLYFLIILNFVQNVKQDDTSNVLMLQKSQILLNDIINSNQK